ncbi:MAG: hypothetical protein R3343_05865 [Nitriliruptorales bacterium]|nr:hypothetical protein [Nitriliruptorales bacterium]
MAPLVVVGCVTAEVFVIAVGEWHLTPATLGIVFATLGAIITWRVPGHRFGPLYLAIAAVSAAFQVTNHLEPGALAGWGYLVAASGWAVPSLLAVTFGLLLLPDGRLPSPRWRWLLRSATVCVAVTVLAMPFDPESPTESVSPLGVLPQTVFDVALLVIVVTFLASFIGGIAAVIVRFRRADDPRVRRQLQLVAFAGVVALMLYLASDAITSTGWVGYDLLVTVALGLIPVAVTIGIVRHGMFDIDRLVSRAVSYVIVSGILAAVYGSIVLVPTTLLGSTDVPDLAVAGATLVAAAIFRPVRSRTQALVDRRFNRARYDADRTLEAFGATLRNEVQLESLGHDLRSAVGVTVAPTHVSLWLTEGGGT